MSESIYGAHLPEMIEIQQEMEAREAAADVMEETIYDAADL